MDWPRAKRLLLLMFLAVDLLLGYRVWWNARQNALWAVPAVAAAGQDARARLSEMGILVLGDIPTAPRSLPVLRVRTSLPDGEEWARALFPEGWDQVSPWAGSEGGRTYYLGSQQLTILPEAGLVFFDRGPAAEASPPKTEEARRQAEAFLQRLGMDQALLRFDGAEDRGAWITVRYVAEDGSVPLFGAYHRFEVDADGVRRFEAVRLEVIAASTEERLLIPAAVALERAAAALSREGGKSVAVQDVRLGYWSPFYETAREWDLLPVWRIRTERGDTFYVNAYTAVLEEEERSNP